MAKPSPKQKEIVQRVMQEFKEGELEQRNGEPVEERKQAVAIALSEAGTSNRKPPAENRKAPLRRDAAGGTPDDGQSRDALYAEAQRRDIPGRSKMTKAQLEHALGR